VRSEYRKRFRGSRVVANVSGPAAFEAGAAPGTVRDVKACPKRMVFGPCGGVRPDGACEVVLDELCVFDREVEWAGPDREPVSLPRVPLVLADFTSAPFDVAGHHRVAEILAPVADAVLVGEHQNRPDLPPTQFAALLIEAGTRPWITLACRDRNAIVLEQEIVGLRQAGADAVLCVTGDARGYDVRPEVTQVFDLDGPRLAALAAGLGVAAAVPETPCAPPADRRAHRLLQKQRAGASVAVLNYAPLPAVRSFVEQARGLGLRIPVLAAVPVYTDARSAAVLDALPGLELDHDAVSAVLGSADPVTAGIAAAVSFAEQLLEIDGVEGVNLSGSATADGYEAGAEIKARVAEELHRRRG
jgi:5,10-methylenetetrahydrofolate reductase